MEAGTVTMPTAEVGQEEQSELREITGPAALGGGREAAVHEIGRCWC